MGSNLRAFARSLMDVPQHAWSSVHAGSRQNTVSADLCAVPHVIHKIRRVHLFSSSPEEMRFSMEDDFALSPGALNCAAAIALTCRVLYAGRKHQLDYVFRTAQGGRR